MKPLVIYHANCADGFTAAWLFNRWYGEQHPRIDGTWPHDWIVDHHAAVYGDNPPDVTDRDVWILDFSYPPAMISAMALAANSITLIDHHESAIRKFMETGWVCPDNVKMTLDTTRSGAYLTAMHLWPGKDPDLMVRLVDDRDRWVFHYPDTKPFHAGLFSRLMTIDNWNAAAHNVAGTVNDGIAIDAYRQKSIRELIGQTAVWRMHAGQPIMVANVPYLFASEAGHMMLEQNPGAWFAALYYVNQAGEYVYSLRSRKGEANVARVAEEYNGGGHPEAAGFKSKVMVF